MAKGNLYTGKVLEGDVLKVAVVRITNKKLQLVRLNKMPLVSKLEKNVEEFKESDEDVFSELGEDLSDDSVFDIDLDAALKEGEDDDDDLNLDMDFDLEEDILGDLEGSDSDDEEDDLELDLEGLEESDELIDLDMVDETGAPASNEMLFYSIVSAVNTKKARIALNIPAGVAIFQILKDVDFNEVKKKDLKIIVDDRLESLYGTPKGEDYYSYGVRDDGALLLSSIDEDPLLLQLANRSLSMFKGKLFIEEVLPDETILLGLIRANYTFEDDGITCVIQFSEENCRVNFLKGDKLWLVSPIITEGVNSKKFLNTVFSKILFQLDTGEVPNLDRLIICNNSLEEEAIDFFRDRFPDVDVSEFEFSEDFFDPGDHTEISLSQYTTAIGTAWSATGFEKKHFSGISFLPKYVIDRQKIFKLQWHGFLILLMIMISFPVMDEVRRQVNTEIDAIENEISLLNTQIQTFAPTVNNYNRISAELGQIQDKLVLLNSLAENSITWSYTLDLLNSGIQDINSVWLTSVSVGEEPNTLEIQGIARYRNRIPMIAELFDEATLLNVSRSDIREEEVFTFSYQISSIVEDNSVYTPSNLKGLEELTGQ